MVFPSIPLIIEPTLVGTMSAWAIITFSIIIHRWKKIALLTLLTLTLFLSFKSHLFAFGFVPGGCGTLCMNNRNYWGPTWGGGYPVYPFPTMPYHSFYGPTPYYFQPFPYSPYRPTGYNDCPHCFM